MIRNVIKPRNIDTECLWNTFGNRETEISAAYIINLLKIKNEWHSFTFDEINEYYTNFVINGRFNFNRLIDQKYITKSGGEEDYYSGTFHIEEKFVEAIAKKATIEN